MPLPTGVDLGQGSQSLPASLFPSDSHKGKKESNPYPLMTKMVLVWFVTGFSISGTEVRPSGHLPVSSCPANDCPHLGPLGSWPGRSSSPCSKGTLPPRGALHTLGALRGTGGLGEEPLGSRL